MSSAEQQQLAAIERHLTDESPDLVLALTGARHPDAAHRRHWVRAGMVTVLVSLVLLAVGVGAGVAALAVSSLCPLLTYLLLAAGERHVRGGPARTW